MSVPCVYETVSKRELKRLKKKCPYFSSAELAGHTFEVFSTVKDQKKYVGPLDISQQWNDNIQDQEKYWVHMCIFRAQTHLTHLSLPDFVQYMREHQDIWLSLNYLNAYYRIHFDELHFVMVPVRISNVPVGDNYDLLRVRADFDLL